MRLLLGETVKMMNGSQMSWEGSETRTGQVYEKVLPKESQQDKLCRMQVVGGGESKLKGT